MAATWDLRDGVALRWQGQQLTRRLHDTHAGSTAAALFGVEDGKRWHNDGNREHGEEEENVTILTNTYAAMNSEGDGRRRDREWRRGTDQRRRRRPGDLWRRRGGGRCSPPGCESNRGDDDRRRRREVQQGLARDQNTTANFGLTATIELRWISASGKGWTGWSLTLRSRERWRRRSSTAEAAARGGWSGCRRWTEKTNAATALQATT
jgi:hypothetical protein